MCNRILGAIGHNLFVELGDLKVERGQTMEQKHVDRSYALRNGRRVAELIEHGATTIKATNTARSIVFAQKEDSESPAPDLRHAADGHFGQGLVCTIHSGYWGATSRPQVF